ncbi:MAG: triose-phosphate isomerase [Candidatus Tectomicrobia bacterium]|uniref:Triosephosphate isomerase n=1 Tax=Tectimicrobiota bacterium TaxID=2528274 RepID=A0A932I2G0_UNCTE|nr:triose-phosphate isomerase [Candidatus Tectomicrobia bacterium]
MRTPLVAGNWKMNKTIAEGHALAQAVAQGRAGMAGAKGGAEVVLAPPFLALPAVAGAVKGTGVGVAGQNCSAEKDGAFTGEVSVSMLKDAGATHVILGHSERRELMGETDAQVARKAAAALAGGLVPIVCLGEALPVREAGKTLEHVGRQVQESILSAFPSPPQGLIVAYEPVWAIGTGRTATPAQAQEVHAFIRERLQKTYGVDWAAKTRILYGGSVKPDNAAELFAQPDIDGGLIGGASLKSGDFLAIVGAASSVRKA